MVHRQRRNTYTGPMPSDSPLCPFCNSPMTKGLLSTQGPVQWFDGKPGFFQELLGGGDIINSEVDMIRGSHIEGWRCNACCKLLLDFHATPSGQV
ncbi:PF20097 family protein [Geothrix sp. 21YS21S-2]|uniref:PF20097 family protein n=1 Tax=Geothrix sp. 21YS21S-2 TaxID=3068893 RepID=UPI00358FBB63